MGSIASKNLLGTLCAGFLWFPLSNNAYSNGSPSSNPGARRGALISDSIFRYFEMKFLQDGTSFWELGSMPCLINELRILA